MPSRKVRRSPLGEILSSEEDFDCSSVGSTMTTSTKSGKSNRQHYHVKFDLSLTQKYARPAIDDKELRTRWYSSKDNEKMKEYSFEKARTYSKDDAKNGGKHSCAIILGKLLEVCSKAKEDTDKILLKKKDFSKLVVIFADYPDRVGLETAINYDLMADKLNRRYTVLRNVMSEQGGSQTIQDLLRGPTDHKDVARVSEKFSLCSRLVSRHLAEAAAAAAAMCWK